ncbi:hypothetical protein ACYE2N_00480 [Flavobacterium sp. MAHUQ-51]|uniref:hypothetical protein n=1 Tax=Flavobacterium sp. GCM10022190 TaxID=3252639 RepID=UPI003606DDBB
MKSKLVFRKDSQQTNALVKAGKMASERAIKESKDLGLSITFMSGGVIYEETSEGKIKVIKQIDETIIIPFEIKKGLVLKEKIR